MKSEWVGKWQGKIVVCIASGPSLTPEDCNLVRASGYPTIVTNTTFRDCPWAHVLFGFDAAWWKEYHKEVDAVFKGIRVTTSQIAVQYGAVSTHQQHWFRNFGNSGADAISLAVVACASKIIMIGYDAQKTGGKTHHHGDHPAPLSNCRSMKNWPVKFLQVATYAKRMKVPVINCSRVSALKCFERGILESELNQVLQPVEA